jgi:hypothetical protein
MLHPFRVLWENESIFSVMLQAFSLFFPRFDET